MFMKQQFLNDNEIKSEIINLSAILNLPKGTEEFVSDVHGEYDEFVHILRNGSGNTRQKISEIFTGQLTEENQKKLAFLIYYPSEILSKTKSEFTSKDRLVQWYLDTFNQLIQLLKYTAKKYTRSKVRKALDADFVYITEELLYVDRAEATKNQYYFDVMDSIIKLGMADQFIIATCHTIQALVVDHIHIIGDVYDRGPHPDLIIEHLIHRNVKVDFQWGNHDILWLGSASGSKLCLANLVRISSRYDNLNLLNEAYKIDTSKLEKFAVENYKPLDSFNPKSDTGKTIDAEIQNIDNCVQQAMAIIQFKLEGQAIDRRPEFKMEDRKLLEKLFDDGQKIKIADRIYYIKNGCFQLVDPDNPYQLTKGEQEIIDDLAKQFISSVSLRRHLQYMVEHGSMYLKNNGNLLIHGCVPVDKSGNMLQFQMNNQVYSGRQLFDYFEQNIFNKFEHPSVDDSIQSDLIWYLWTGKLSPLFGKSAMTTFERYFIEDKDLHKEHKNSYYSLRKEEWFADILFDEFDLDKEQGHIINGHTPVKIGNSPIMANGKIFVIDGGMSKPYQKTTGIGGYTLLSNSFGLQLVTHEPFTTREKAIQNMTDVVSTKRVIEQSVKMKTVSDTDNGKKLKAQVDELINLLAIKKE
ncbi:fructose-1,6-bisphosphatase [Lactobacillus terrae]|uniref:fructose-1,6-bisphosphatase n=1 Tax=Lactobacillus terrae TaxID=2269374 RepID=UPI000C1B748C|nr:fructose-1,6-bisphosphatase [Lactobacillus terrae]